MSMISRISERVCERILWLMAGADICLDAKVSLGRRYRVLVNRTKELLRAGGTAVGCFVRYPDAGITELLALQGFDFLVLDGEHGTIEPYHCEAMVRAAELREATPIVRVPVNAPSTILRFLDTGAQGVHVPLVRSAEDAAAAVRAVKYWPDGSRGLAGVRAADYAQRAPLAEYIADANQQTLVVVQIETREALERVDEFVELSGVDVIFVGPMDLSQALGVPGRTGELVLTQAFDRVAEAVRGSHAALGVLVSDEAGAREWIERGERYVAFVIEAIVSSRAQAILRTLRA
jgi:4-hydroxy-2-oxoheptanedioate aldolase